jgi:hypothetical protein
MRNGNKRRNGLCYSSFLPVKNLPKRNLTLTN